jgi:hypothetical protein
MLWLSSEPDKRQTTQSELAITGGIIKCLEKPIVSGMEISQTAGHDDLAKQIANLKIISRCHCGDDFCATFYTKPKPRGYGAGRKSIDLDPQQGMIILDVMDGSIVEVEVPTSWSTPSHRFDC